MSKNFYITTTLPYVNSEPHIGFAGEIIQADVLARFHRELGDKVFFNTGTDEHGLKIYRKTQELGMNIQEYCDKLAKTFINLKSLLNLSFDKFIRTTDKNHIEAAQEFWKRCEKNGDIYKKMYKVKYCVGCELEKTDSELIDGKCPLHPNQEIECIEEENYFFRFSKYQKPLLSFYEKNPDFVLPKKRFNEIKAFVERGLEDFSISRMKEKMPWGIDIPGDPKHVMYVWFDALVNYISALGWPASVKASAGKPNNLWKFWSGYQIAGKDNLRQQAAMWQAMLMSAGIKNSKQIFIRGFITNKGEKMSKSQGNFISAKEMVDKFGIDGSRYLLLSVGGNFGEDTDVTWEKFTEKYNADLANGIGNLTSRIVALYGKTEEVFDLNINFDLVYNKNMISWDKNLKNCQLNFILDEINGRVKHLDREIERVKPWELIKSNTAKFQEETGNLVRGLNEIAYKLIPFMPKTSEKIRTALETREPIMLFPRIK